jgi:hypothetical protein
MEILLKIFLLITFFSLGIDSYRNPQTIYEWTGVSSSTLFVLVMLLTPWIVQKRLAVLPSKIITFLGSYIFPFTLMVGVGFTFADAYMYPNFIYGITRINYQFIVYIALLCGWIVLWHRPSSWIQSHKKTLIFRAGWSLVALAFLVVHWPKDFFVILSQEDHFIENVQALALVVASGFALKTAIQLKRHTKTVALFYAIAAFGLLFVAGDEIAWGQRFLGLTVPAFFQTHNTQGEVTVHNLGQISNSVGILYTLISLWGSASWIIAPKLKKFGLLVSYFTTRWYMFPYFYIGFIFNYRTLMGPHTIGIWSEFAELMLYLGICLFFIQASTLPTPKAQIESDKWLSGS